jgi:hypothetical protein
MHGLRDPASILTSLRQGALAADDSIRLPQLHHVDEQFRERHE